MERELKYINDNNNSFLLKIYVTVFICQLCWNRRKAGADKCPFRASNLKGKIKPSGAILQMICSGVSTIWASLCYGFTNIV